MQAKCLRLFLAVTALTTPLVSFAANTSSVSREMFQAAVSAQRVTQQDFDALSPGTVLGTLDGVSYSVSSGSPLVTDTYLTSTGLNGLGQTGVGFFLRSDSATFTFSSPISAFAIDINTYANALGDYTAQTNTGDVVTSFNEVFPNQLTGQFIGFVSSSNFTSVTINASTTSTEPNLSYTLDTLVYGSAVAVVPEPASVTLMLAGLLVVFNLEGRRRRRLVQR